MASTIPSKVKTRGAESERCLVHMKDRCPPHATPNETPMTWEDLVYRPRLIPALGFDCSGTRDERTDFDRENFMRVLVEMEAKINEADKHELKLFRQDEWRSVKRECDTEHGHSRPAALATFFAFDPELCILLQQTRYVLANYGEGHIT